jgi:hypothetical protein
LRREGAVAFDRLSGGSSIPEEKVEKVVREFSDEVNKTFLSLSTTQ